MQSTMIIATGAAQRSALNFRVRLAKAGRDIVSLKDHDVDEIRDVKICLGEPVVEISATK